jgi:hypothetical protein
MVTMNETEIQQQFDRLQSKLVPLWKSISQLNQEEQTIVVVPSITLKSSLGSIAQAYEERFLFLLLLLRQPRARMIYVTSQPILPSIVEYYLGLLPGIIPSHARKRLFLLAPLDGSSQPLTEKILARPKFIEQIRSLIPDPNRAHLIPFNTTEKERELALRLGIPMYGADPKHSHFGSKTGCRDLFEEEAIMHPIGYQNLFTIADLALAIAKIRIKRPHAKEVVVKLNEGVSGRGNARVKLSDLPLSKDPTEIDAIIKRIHSMEFESDTVTFDSYMKDFEQQGGVVEERLVGKEIRSPSVQMRVTPLGELQILSTHDQLLGGPSGQSYLGARFPADPAYAAFISREAARLGKRLANAGVIGRFAVDFLVVKTEEGDWKAYAIEINLRKGGTTHPFLTLQFLTGGNYNLETAVFTAPSGAHKYFVASDHVEWPELRGLTPEDLFDISVRNGLHFDQTKQTGVVFHMICALSEHGRLGLTAVEESPEKATALYDRIVSILEQESAAASKQKDFPEIKS